MSKATELHEKLKEAGIPIVSTSGGTQENFKVSQLAEGEPWDRWEQQIAAVVNTFDWTEKPQVARKEWQAKIEAMKPEERDALLLAVNMQAMIDYLDRNQKGETEIKHELEAIAVVPK